MKTLKMKFHLFALVLLWTVISMISAQAPKGFENLGNYGTQFATRKTYYRSTGPIGVSTSVFNYNSIKILLQKKNLEWLRPDGDLSGRWTHHIKFGDAGRIRLFFRVNPKKICGWLDWCF